MGIINITCFLGLLLPVLYSAYILYSKFALFEANKKILNYGNLIINIFLLVLFSIQSLFVIKNNLSLEYSFINIIFNGFNFNFGFLLTGENSILLPVVCACFCIISFFSVIYFDWKKHFTFTKSKFYIFLALFAFNTYLYLLSPNLLQLFIFWILQGSIIFIFSYFDIYKNSINYNITRYNRIAIFGDFAILAAILILFKYSFINNTGSLNLDILSLHDIINNNFATSINTEFKLCCLCFVLAVFSRLSIFPLNCYYSFLANSSGILFVCISSFVNLIYGLYLFILTSPFIKSLGWSKYIAFYCLISGTVLLFSAIFEKNIKIIFGCLISSLSAFYLAGSLLAGNRISLCLYILFSFVLSMILMCLFLKDKVNIKPKFFTKKKGFIVERVHIFIFEKLPLKLFKILYFADKYIVQKFILFFIELADYFIKLFVTKTKSKNKSEYIRIIFFVFALMLIFGIFVALFGSGRYNYDFIE